MIAKTNKLQQNNKLEMVITADFMLKVKHKRSRYLLG